MPLRRVKKATLTAFKTSPSRDGFAWRVKMTPHMILLLPFLILGEKEVPRRGMSGNEGLGGTLPQKGCLGEEGCPFTPPVTLSRATPL